MYMLNFFLKTPLLIYLISFQIFFPKFGVWLICECGLYAGVYGNAFNILLQPVETFFLFFVVMKKI